MPFTDTQLATQMEAELVNSGLMTDAEKLVLFDDSTEVKVKETLSDVQIGKFSTYWQSIGTWISGQGGNIATITGMLVTGRINEAGNSEEKPKGISLIAMYNDAFNDTNKYIGKEGFLPVKAISNNLRFVKVIMEY